METFIIPGWIWLNLVILVAAAVFVAVKLAIDSRSSGHGARPQHVR